MNIVGFIASPRKKGNTAWSVNKILEGANEAGAKTTPFYASDLDILPCQGCLGCKKNEHGCIVNDDMKPIYDLIESADTLILGSPVYMGQMSAQAKVFTDRLFAQISPRFSPHYKERAVKKKLVLVFTQGNPNPEFFQAYYDYTKHMFELLEFDVQGVHIISGTRNGPAHEQKDLDIMMKKVGSSLVL